MPDEVAEATQTPFCEKQPLKIDQPPEDMVEVPVMVAEPFTAKYAPGLEVAIPTLPSPSIMKAVAVPNVVEVETANTA